MSTQPAPLDPAALAASFQGALTQVRAQVQVLQSYLDHGLPAGAVGVTQAINDLLKMTILLANTLTGQYKGAT